MTDVLLSKVPFGSLPVFIALLEIMCLIFTIAMLTLSNLILLSNFLTKIGCEHGGQTKMSRLQTFPQIDKEEAKIKNNDIRKAAPSDQIPDEVVDLSGTYKLESKENFDEFLASQGVGWAIRKAADKAVPTHVITHNQEEHSVTIRVEGIISSQTTYKINGDPIETRLQSRVFKDTMKYIENGKGVQVTKVCEAEGYHIFVKRSLSSCKNFMTVSSTAIWPDKQVESHQVFRKLDN